MFIAGQRMTGVVGGVARRRESYLSGSGRVGFGSLRLVFKEG